MNEMYIASPLCLRINGVIMGLQLKFCFKIILMKVVTSKKTSVAKTLHGEWTRVLSCGRSWWRHEMETFSALLVFCAGNSPVTGEKGQRRRVLMFSLICALNKRWNRQSWIWWFETPSRPLWRHCNVFPGHRSNIQWCPKASVYTVMFVQMLWRILVTGHNICYCWWLCISHSIANHD